MHWWMSKQKGGLFKYQFIFLRGKGGQKSNLVLQRMKKIVHFVIIIVQSKGQGTYQHKQFSARRT